MLKTNHVAQTGDNNICFINFSHVNLNFLFLIYIFSIKEFNFLNIKTNQKPTIYSYFFLYSNSKNEIKRKSKEKREIF